MKASKNRRFSDKQSSGTSFVAEGSIFEGQMRGSGDVIVCGEVHGDGHINGTVTISDTGLWNGELSARNILVAGRVEGAIVANGQIEICESAVIKGTVTGHAIAVGQGAVIDGEINTLHGEAKEFEESRSESTATHTAA
ncbi:MAG: polymer-forming cytoskeletal protein [Pseudomonadota bacterium]